MLLLPVRERYSTGCAAFALLAYYALTATHDLSLYDSGELALAAVQLGLGHPPGQPLHTLLGFLLAHVPLWTPLFGVALASVLPAALTLVPATSLAQALLGPGAPRAVHRMVPWLIALGALHSVLWEPATRVEVYALSTFFAVWAVARLASSELSAKHVFAAGVALGLSASANPMVALCIGLAVAPALLLASTRKQLPARAIPAALFGGVLGLLPYVYLFVITQRDDVMIWGAPRDAASLWHYLTLQDYKTNHALTLPLWLSHFVAWFPWATRHGLLPLLALGLAGHAELGPRSTLGRSAGPLTLVLLVAQISFNVVWNLEVPDYAGYMASALWLLLSGSAAYAAHVLLSGRRFAAAFVSGALIVSALVTAPHVFARTRPADHLARALAEQALREAPRNAIVIAELDYLAGSLFYLQEAEHARPDVVVLAYGLGSSRWHWERIFRRHRDLVPIPLAGPGGKPARVRRLIDANHTRPVLLERASMAAELGLAVCPGGLYLRTREACSSAMAPSPAVPALLARTLGTLHQGSPGADAAIAQIAFALGESAWHLDHPRSAYAAFLSGVPRELWPRDAAHVPDELAKLPVLRAPLPAFERSAALGDPARNLFVVGMMLEAVGRHDEALAMVRAAADTGLPEALALLQPPTK